jgi:hypothetical protein
VKHEAKVEVAAAAAAAAVAVEVQQEVTKDAPASPDTTANEHPTAASAPTAGTLDEQVFIQAEQAAPDQCAVKADVTGAEVKKTDGEENKKEDQDEEKSAGAASASHGEEAAAAAAVPDTLTPAPTTPPPPAPAKSTTPERPSLLARAKTSLPEIQPDTSGSSFTFLSPATTPRGVSRCVRGWASTTPLSYSADESSSHARCRFMHLLTLAMPPLPHIGAVKRLLVAHHVC